MFASECLCVSESVCVFASECMCVYVCVCVSVCGTCALYCAATTQRQNSFMSSS